MLYSESSQFEQVAIENPEDQAARSEVRKALEICLERLPVDFRVVTVLVDIQGYDYRAAAEMIDKPVGTVKSRLARARERMRDCLQQRRELFTPGRRLEDEGTS